MDIGPTIGHGAMGAVHEGYILSKKMRVAIKRINVSVDPTKPTGSQLISALIDEVHPFLCLILDSHYTKHSTS